MGRHVAVIIDSGRGRVSLATMAFLAFIAAGCNVASFDRQPASTCNAATGENCNTASVAEQEAHFEKKLEEKYRGTTDANGRVTSMPGYEASTAGSGANGAITAEDIAKNPQTDLFKYEAPPETEAEYSAPQMVTASFLRLAGSTSLACELLSYAKSVPKIGDLDKVNASFITCIKLTFKTGKVYYLETPPVAVAVGDLTKPSSLALSINNGAAATASTNLSLSITAINAVDMIITNNNNCSGNGTWTTYATSLAWTLPTTNAVQHVSIKFRNGAGVESDCISASITHDDTAPTAPTSVNDGAWAYGSSSPLVSWSGATDAGSGIASYQLALQSTGTWQNVGAVTSASLSGLAMTVGATDKIGVRAVDAAGNVGSATWGDGFGFGWHQQDYLKAGNAGAADAFGYAIAMSGTTMAVAAIDEDSAISTVTNSSLSSSDDSRSAAGAVYIYKRAAWSWTQEAFVKPSNSDANDRFGHALGLSGDTLVVTTPYEDSNVTTVTNSTSAPADNSAASAGAAYVYRRTATTWAPEAFLKAGNAQAGDMFGWSVAIDGDTVVIGAKDEDSGVYTDPTNNAAASAGAAYVFSRTGTSWSQQAYLKALNANSNDEFGQAVTISGTTVAIAAPGESSSATTISNSSSAADTDNSASRSGAVYVYKRSGTLWVQEAVVKASNAGTSDSFGYDAVSLSGDTLAVGAVYESSSVTTVTNGASASPDDSLTRSGAAYIFKRTGTSWAQEAYLKAANAGSYDYFGWPVALSGDVLAVGASEEDSAQTTVSLNGSAPADDNAPNSGAVYIYKRTGTTWASSAYLKASNSTGSNAFGLPLALEGNALLIGNPYEDNSQTTISNNALPSPDTAATNAGAAYFFVQ